MVDRIAGYGGTDTERIDFIERMVKGNRAGVGIQRNSLIGSQPGMEEYPVEIFTIPSQHRYGKTVREVIDIAIMFGEMHESDI